MEKYGLKGLIQYFKIIVAGVIIALFSSLILPDMLKIKQSEAAALGLVEPTQMLKLSRDFQDPVLKGLKINPNDISDISFLVDSGNSNKLSKTESQRLINYFLAALAIDNESLWVNLSPYEANRIIDSKLENTELGRDMLSQDYILKQLSSSLTHPKSELGKSYWQKMDHNISESKIWISADKVEIFEKSNAVFINKALLKVESEDKQSKLALNELIENIKNDVNNGKNFAKLRQIYHSVILARWFKNKFKESVYRGYIEQNNLSAIDDISPEIKDKIWNLYCESFNKGVYDTVKLDSINKRKRYFSGGLVLNNLKMSSALNADLNKLEYNGTIYTVRGAALRLYPDKTINRPQAIYKTRISSLTLKRSLDIATSLFLLITFSPFIIMTALWIKSLTLINPKWAGPVLFNPTRIGKDGKEFTMYKFRTMYDDQDSLEKPYLPGGRFIRIFLDELPQLLNILKGDMSLVGPRPYDKKQNEYLSNSIPNWNLRYKDTRPGFFGKRALMVTLGKYKSQVTDEAYQFDNSGLGRSLLNLDIDYTENHNVKTDFEIALASIISFGKFKTLSYKLAKLSQEDVIEFDILYNEYKAAEKRYMDKKINGGIDLMDLPRNNASTTSINLAPTTAIAAFSLTYQISDISKTKNISEFAKI